MISEDEVRRAAARWHVDPMIVDLDYVLGCFLSQWSLQPATARMRLKGGTCLRKCYFSEYRFSEDLDFTVEEELDIQVVGGLTQNLRQRIRDTFGIDLAAAPPRIRSMTDEDNEASVEAKLYYRGPLRRTGDPQAIRLHISSQEHLAFQGVTRRIHHPYGDSHLVQPAMVLCYDLREVLAEKIRAISGQRRYAISRDLYDLHHLLTEGGLSLGEVESVLGPKFAAKGLNISSVNPATFEARKGEFQRDWSQNLAHLVPSPLEVTFEDAWKTALRALDQVASLA